MPPPSPGLDGGPPLLAMAVLSVRPGVAIGGVGVERPGESAHALPQAIDVVEREAHAEPA